MAAVTLTPEQLEDLINAVTRSLGSQQAAARNLPGALGTKNFTEAMNKNIEKLDVKTFKDWNFRVEMAAKAIHVGYHQLLTQWEMR